ncbi:MAG: hypothetical protein QME78_11580 [Thermodesulfobacteriota bacterium]|nr:hypothetical protein [Thermodesulfobacteriota bacterium]
MILRKQMLANSNHISAGAALGESPRVSAISSAFGSAKIMAPRAEASTIRTGMMFSPNDLQRFGRGLKT